MAQTFHCSIVTPTGLVFEGDVTYASVPAWDGQIGVMTGTSPVLTRMEAGHLRLDVPGEGIAWYLVDGGFAQVQDDNLTLLTEMATTGESISREEAQAELAEANARVTGQGADQARVTADQRRAMAKLALLEKSGRRG